MLICKFTIFLKRTTYLKTNIRSKWSSENVKVFEQLFDLSHNRCKRYRHEHKIPPLSREHLHANSEFCESIGVSKQEWLKYPTLIKQLPLTLEQKYLQLKEGGFVNINAEILSKYRQCTYRKISFLKLSNLIPQHVNVAEHFISYLNPKPDNLGIEDLTDDNIFNDVHHTILTRYLMWRCDATQDTIETFYRIYSLRRIKSFDFLSQNFALTKELGFTPKKLLKYGYLLTMYPKYPQTVLAERPTLAGMDMRKAMRLYPKLITTPPKHYTEIYSYLKSVNISDKAIQKCLNIFYLNPQTVKIRLEEIQSIPELEVLLNNPDFLQLVVHHNEARSRLSFLQQVKLKCTTVAVLRKSDIKFDNYLREGKDVNNSKEIMILLRELLKSDSKLIEINLKKHPYYRHVPLVTIKESHQLLRKLQFTNIAMLEVIQILLYPSYKLLAAYRTVEEFCKERDATLIETLNLMLYNIEKDHHFTGDGIWTNDKEHKC